MCSHCSMAALDSESSNFMIPPPMEISVFLYSRLSSVASIRVSSSFLVVVCDIGVSHLPVLPTLSWCELAYAPSEGPPSTGNDHRTSLLDLAPVFTSVPRFALFSHQVFEDMAL